MPVAATVLVKLATAGEDDEGDLDVAENGELASLLHQAVPPLREGHLATALVLDPLQQHFLAPHSKP